MSPETLLHIFEVEVTFLFLKAVNRFYQLVIILCSPYLFLDFCFTDISHCSASVILLKGKKPTLCLHPPSSVEEKDRIVVKYLAVKLQGCFAGANLFAPHRSLHSVTVLWQRNKARYLTNFIFRPFKQCLI